MSTQDRLLALLVQARQTGGDAALADTAGLTARLSGQAPDLHGEIRALAAALAAGAPARIAAASDPTAERQAIATEIAGRERLAMATVDSALEVLLLSGIDPLGSPAPGMPAPSGSGGWAGDSVLVGAGAPATPGWPSQSHAHQSYAGPDASAGRDERAPAEKPLWDQMWVYGVVAALIVGFAFYYMRAQPEPTQVAQQDPNQGGGQQGPGQGPGQGPPQGGPRPPVGPDGQPLQPGQGGQQPQVGPDGQPLQPGQDGQQGPGYPPQGQGPNGPQNGGGPGGGQGETSLQPGGPTLSTNPNALPRLAMRRASSGATGIGFGFGGQNGQVNGIVVLPAVGWDGGEGTIIGQMGNAVSMGSGRFTLTQFNGAALRVMSPQWKQDGLGVGTMCVAFQAPKGQQDVNPSGSLMCLMDSTCARPVGCGLVQ